VLAIEPSDVMAAQRPPELAPAIRARAGDLPLRDGAVDAAMAILTLHHWDDERERGVRELRRVARGPVVVLTYDAQVSGRMWLIADYLPEVGELDARIFPTPERIAEWLGGAGIKPCRSRATRPTGCSAPSGPIRSACSTRRRAPTRPASPAWRPRWSSA
jgi:hypothetical protein